MSKHAGHPEQSIPGWGNVDTNSHFRNAHIIELMMMTDEDLITFAELPGSGHTDGQWRRLAKEMARRLAA